MVVGDIILPTTVGFSDEVTFEQQPSKELQECHVDIREWGFQALGAANAKAVWENELGMLKDW